MKLRIKRLTETATLPRYMTDGAAGMDLFSDENKTIWPGDVESVKTGIALSVPVGYEAQVRPRSGTAMKRIAVANSPGTVDSDFRGNVCVLLANHAETCYQVNAGDRIAQLVIAPVVRAELVEVDELDETSRGAGGFGHTGK